MFTGIKSILKEFLRRLIARLESGDIKPAKCKEADRGGSNNTRHCRLHASLG